MGSANFENERARRGFLFWQPGLRAALRLAEKIVREKSETLFQ
jgi:hypothetical protein